MLAPASANDAPTAPSLRDSGGLVGHMDDPAGGNERCELIAGIAAEDLAPGIGVAVRTHRGGVVRQRIIRREPPREMTVIAGNEAHSHGWDVDAMRRVARVIGDAAAQARARLEDKNAGVRTAVSQVIGDGRSGEASAYDRNCLGGGLGHPSLPLE